MSAYPLTIDGQECNVTFVETEWERLSFLAWLPSQPVVAVDTETTGLQQFAPGFKVRTVQFGSATEAWVLDAMEFAGTAMSALSQARLLVAHNATYDALALAAHFGKYLNLDPLLALLHDTRTMAHLLDPRAPEEGGTGHGLKALADLFVDRNASRYEDELLALFRAEKWRREEGYALVPMKAPEFIRYAGVDVLLTARLYPILRRQVDDLGMARLYEFERQVSALCARMERAGLLVDREYAESLVEVYETQEAEGRREAAAFGVLNVNSTAQVAEALVATGADLWETTPSGKPKVDKAVLNALSEAGNPVAQAVQKAKRAGKWLQTYVMPMLTQTDAQGRIHPKINALQARTARMSVAAPPLQQLPSGDWTIRRAIIADPGHLMWAADYDQVEMRVLAALADEPKMRAAIAEGVDFHDFTASIVFGPDFTKLQRKLAKGVGFGKVYGGGAETIARQTGAPIDMVREAIRAYDAEFVGVKRYQRTLQGRASVGRREVWTPSGRRLPLDGDRLYAATNYVVQSTSRDVLCQALLDLEAAGLVAGRDLLLPIHDEILGQATPEAFPEMAEVVGRTMSMDFLGVRLTAAADLYGRSWGHGYGAPE